MSSPSVFSFEKIAPGADNPSRSQDPRSSTGSGQNGGEANPVFSVSDGFSNMEIDNDMCYMFGSGRIHSSSNFKSGTMCGGDFSSGNMVDESKAVSEDCMSETESEKLETNACNVANSRCQGDHVRSVFTSNSIIGTKRPGDNCETKDRVVFGSEGKNLCTSGFGFEDMKGKTFPFSEDGGSVREKHQRQNREKGRKKVGHDVFVITPSWSTSVEEVQVPSTYDSHGNCKACAEFQISGNEAHCKNNFLKAQEFYTLGIASISASERSECCQKLLSQCYSDRAAARVSLGKIREALADALMAIQLNDGFPEYRVRAANCYLLLGEVEHALKYFNECLQSKTVVCSDRRVVIDCVDGIKKAKKVAECTNSSAVLLKQRTTDAALSALDIISEALMVSMYSEKLLEMKVDALYLLRRFEEAIQVCGRSLISAEINSDSVESRNGSGCEIYPLARLWRWVFISKTYFQLGRFSSALSFVEQVRSIEDEYGSTNMESSISAAVAIRELLSHKNAGNETFRAGKYTEAVEHYTTALSSNIGSRPFAAICLCNRAAAHQALDQITDAIADCSLAIALDANYDKAVSRRATLHEMVRDYVQAASDVQRLVSILEKKCDEESTTSEGSSNARAEKLQQARRRLPSMEENAKKGIPLNFNLILGIKPSDTSSSIKKAYRMAALKHHPDKAGQFLGRSESRDEGILLCKEISVEIQKDADRLFKMIKEAYDVLSDPSKRSKYDLEEAVRKAANERKEQSSSRKPSDFQSDGYSSYRPSYFQSSNKASTCRAPPYSECPSRTTNYKRYGSHRSPFERTCPDERESWKSYG